MRPNRQRVVQTGARQGSSYARETVSLRYRFRSRWLSAEAAALLAVLELDLSALLALDAADLLVTFELPRCDRALPAAAF